MSKKLVAYFSASGITRNVAKMIAEAAGGPVRDHAEGSLHKGRLKLDG